MFYKALIMSLAICCFGETATIPGEDLENYINVKNSADEPYVEDNHYSK